MKNYVTSALHTLTTRQPGSHEWSRLGRKSSGHATATQRQDFDSTVDGLADADTAEMRRFLAAQTSQTV